MSILFKVSKSHEQQQCENGGLSLPDEDHGNFPLGLGHCHQWLPCWRFYDKLEYLPAASTSAALMLLCRVCPVTCSETLGVPDMTAELLRSESEEPKSDTRPVLMTHPQTLAPTSHLINSHHVCSHAVTSLPFCSAQAFWFVCVNVSAFLLLAWPCTMCMCVHVQ